MFCWLSGQKSKNLNHLLTLFRLYGDYETLSNGRTADALVDFTGGVAEKLVLAEVGLSDTHSQLAFFKKLQEAVENHALVNCNIEVQRVLMF